MPTKPTIMKRARRWASTLSPSLWSLVGLAKPPKATASTSTANLGATTARPVAPHVRHRGGPPAATRETTSTAAAKSQKTAGAGTGGLSSKLAKAIKGHLRAATSQWRPQSAAPAPAAKAPATKAHVGRPGLATSVRRAEEDSFDEMTGDSAAAQARRRERTRCESIVTCAAGQANPALARKLAFETRMPVSEALEVLATAPAPVDRAAASAARAARNPNVGADGPLNRSRQQDLNSRWDRVIAAARHPGGPVSAKEHAG